MTTELKYKPSVMWIVVADNWRAQKVASAGLGIARVSNDVDDRLCGTFFVACFKTRKAAKKMIRGPGLRVVPVTLTITEPAK